MTIPDWQSRTELLLGTEALKKLRNSHVLLAGLGGVGAMAAEQLVRTGLGEITLADNDHLTASNINRQIIALHSLVGKKKTEVLAARLRDINPELIIHTEEHFLKDKVIPELLNQQHFDYVIDAIDTLTPKIQLIHESMYRNIPLISSMGSGGKTDPEKIHIRDISKTRNCKLGIYKGFTAVYSEEFADEAALVDEHGKNKKTNIGSLPYIPAVFGCMAAAHVITSLVN